MEEDVCVQFFCFTSIVSPKSSVNIAVASWFTTVVSKVGDLYAWLSSGISYGGRRLGTII